MHVQWKRLSKNPNITPCNVDILQSRKLLRGRDVLPRIYSKDYQKPPNWPEDEKFLLHLPGITNDGHICLHLDFQDMENCHWTQGHGGPKVGKVNNVMSVQYCDSCKSHRRKPFIGIPQFQLFESLLPSKSHGHNESGIYTSKSSSLFGTLDNLVERVITREKGLNNIQHTCKNCGDKKMRQSVVFIQSDVKNAFPFLEDKELIDYYGNTKRAPLFCLNSNDFKNKVPGLNGGCRQLIAILYQECRNCFHVHDMFPKHLLGCQCEHYVKHFYHNVKETDPTLYENWKKWAKGALSLLTMGRARLNWTQKTASGAVIPSHLHIQLKKNSVPAAETFCPFDSEKGHLYEALDHLETDKAVKNKSPKKSKPTAKLEKVKHETSKPIAKVEQERNKPISKGFCAFEAEFELSQERTSLATSAITNFYNKSTRVRGECCTILPKPLKASTPDYFHLNFRSTPQANTLRHHFYSWGFYYALIRGNPRNSTPPYLSRTYNGIPVDEIVEDYLDGQLDGTYYYRYTKDYMRAIEFRSAGHSQHIYSIKCCNSCENHKKSPQFLPPTIDLCYDCPDLKDNLFCYWGHPKDNPTLRGHSGVSNALLREAKATYNKKILKRLKRSDRSGNCKSCQGVNTMLKTIKVVEALFKEPYHFSSRRKRLLNFLKVTDEYSKSNHNIVCKVDFEDKKVYRGKYNKPNDPSTEVCVYHIAVVTRECVNCHDMPVPESKPVYIGCHCKNQYTDNSSRVELLDDRYPDEYTPPKLQMSYI